jgi:hypothetical protein
MSPPSSALKNKTRNQHEAGSKQVRSGTFSELHGIISQTMELFITTVVRTSDPTYHVLICPESMFFQGNTVSQPYKITNGIKVLKLRLSRWELGRQNNLK